MSERDNNDPTHLHSNTSPGGEGRDTTSSESPTTSSESPTTSSDAAAAEGAEHSSTPAKATAADTNSATTPTTAPRGDEEDATGGKTKGISRRHLFRSAGVASALGIAGFGLGWAGGKHQEANAHHTTAPTKLQYDFRGEHQAGIITPAQDNMYTAAFDITTTSRDELEKMLTQWTTAAEQMCAGELIGGEPLANRSAVPKDTGEAWGYSVNGLTITFGFGKGLFVDADGNDRFGLKDKMPAVLQEGMPKFANEALREAASGGDLLVQACSNDAQVCVHAIRNLTRIGFGTVRLRWGQIGYGRTSSTTKDQETPRNLFGFKDGTQNIKADDGADQLNEHLWVQSGDDQANWMAGGSYYMARKIHMYLEVWDRLSLQDQEESIGRDKRYGAPLSVTSPSNEQEFTAADYSAKDGSSLLIPADAHIAVVSPEQNNGYRMLRRGYNYTDGNDSLGRLDAGLFFVAYVRDPRQGFYDILKKMTLKDALTEYLQHQASALFAIPPGVGDSDLMVGQKLFKG